MGGAGMRGRPNDGESEREEEKSPVEAERIRVKTGKWYSTHRSLVPDSDKREEEDEDEREQVERNGKTKTRVNGKRHDGSEVACMVDARW